MRYGFLIITAFILIAACARDEKNNEPVESSNDALWLVNEGNFLNGNASLFTYNPVNMKLEAEVFSRVNDRPLGDVFQSIFFDGDRAYLVINNSGKIEVVNKSNYQSITTIDELPSPRYIAKANNKLFVSNFTLGSESEISVIENDAVVARIPTEGWTEGITAIGNYVYACNSSTGNLLKISAETYDIEDRLELEEGISDIVYNGTELLVFALNNDDFTCYKVSPESFQQTESLSYSGSYAYSGISWKENYDTFYVAMENGIVKFPANGSFEPETIINSSRNFYNLSYIDDNIYVSDAKDYARRGVVLRYNLEGKIIDSFQAGIIPSELYKP